MTVNLHYSGGGLASTTTTDANGFYSFVGVTPGDYYVDFVLPFNYVFSQQDQGGNNELDSDANITTGQTAVTTLSAYELDNSWDAGMYTSTPGMAAIGDRVWLDTDEDGIQDGGEVGINNVKVDLYKQQYTPGSYDQRIQSSTDDAHQEGTTMKVGDNDLKVGRSIEGVVCVLPDLIYQPVQ